MLKRKLCWIGIPWLCSLALFEIFHDYRALILLLAISALLIVASLLRKLPTRSTLCAIISMCLASLLISSYTVLKVDPVLAKTDALTTFSGTITEATAYNDTYAIYTVRGKFADGTRAKIIVTADDFGAEYGDTLDVAGSFIPFEDTYLYSSATYYRTKGIYLESSADAYVKYTPATSPSLMRTLNRYRERIATRITVLAGSDAGGMMSAMLLGDRSDLADETRSAFSKSGISHVLAVSGLHLTLLLSLLLGLARRFSFNRLATFIVATVITILYALLVGTPISIIRAGLMFLLTLAAPLLYRKADALSSICFAGIIITVAQPYAILDASFLLSIMGTFGITVFAPWMTANLRCHYHLPRPLVSFLSYGCAFVPLFPITLCFYDSASLLSPISNMILVPIASLMLLLSLFIFLTGGVGIIAKPLCFLCRLLYRLIMFLSQGLNHLFPWTFPAGWRFLTFLCLILCLFTLTVYFFWKTRRAVAVALVISFICLFMGQITYRLGEKNTFLITILGNNCGVIVVSYQDSVDVIDITGNHNNPQYLVSYFTQRGCRAVNSFSFQKAPAQMRVLYAETFPDLVAGEIILPTVGYTMADMTVCGAPITLADDYTITDPNYTITVADGAVMIQYGAARFAITSTLNVIPEDCTAILCATCKVNADDIPIYEYTEPIQIRADKNGGYRVVEVG